jgi:hypothetical protein
MGQAAKAARENRTITVDFHDDSTYFQLINSCFTNLSGILGRFR